MLYDGSRGIFLERRHLDRLEASAVYFGIPCDARAIARALADLSKRYGDTRQRVRLVLSEEGEIAVTATPLPAAAAARMRFVVSGTRVDPADPLLYHKTTRRTLYDGEHAKAQEAHGADEVIFLNAREEIAEGSRTNLFIERDGVLLTPALACGLLPGTLRAELLASGRAKEAILTPADLDQGQVFLGNSVRGLVAAEQIRSEAPVRKAG
jgi:para-aminobenzoate synthetase/4-amino-4-deoxychorismate lyase